MSNTWLPREKWDALVLGENCPLCEAVKPRGVDKGFSHFIADLSMGRLSLHNNQYIKGYCGLICYKHVREPYELPQDEQEQFWDDMMVCGMALEKTFGADKMNFQITGNLVPHLHAHIIPRYYGDAGGVKAADPNEQTVLLTPTEYRDRVEKIRQTVELIRAHRQRGGG